jgi:hypothetical protein
MKKLVKRIKNRVKFYLKEREHKKKLKEMRKKDPFIYD